MFLKFILLGFLFIYHNQSQPNTDEGKSDNIKRSKRSVIDEIKSKTFKKVEVNYDGIQEVEQSTKFK